MLPEIERRLHAYTQATIFTELMTPWQCTLFAATADGELAQVEVWNALVESFEEFTLEHLRHRRDFYYAKYNYEQTFQKHAKSLAIVLGEYV